MDGLHCRKKSDGGHQTKAVTQLFELCPWQVPIWTYNGLRFGDGVSLWSLLYQWFFELRDRLFSGFQNLLTAAMHEIFWWPFGCSNEAPDCVRFFFRFDGCVFLQIYGVPWFPYYWLKSVFQVFYHSFMILIQDDGDNIETGLSCFIFMFHQVKDWPIHGSSCP